MLVDAPEGTQVGPKRRARPLAGVAMDLALAITIVIPRPFAHPVGSRGMARMAAAITLPFVGIEQRAALGHVFRDEVVAGLPVRMVTDPPALLACLARDDADDRGTIVRIGAVPFALIGALAWRIKRVAMRRTFFPLRSGTARRTQRRCPSSGGWVPWRSHGSGCAAAGYGVAYATVPALGPGGPSTHLWPHRAAAVPAQRIVAVAGPTAVSREMALGKEQATLGASTVRALQALRVEMPFEPKHADAVIQ